MFKASSTVFDYKQLLNKIVQYSITMLIADSGIHLVIKDMIDNLAIGSAEDLPPRFRANPRGNARTPPGSARFRRTSAKIIFRRTPPNVRRTSGERSADSARIRADPRGVRRELAEEFTRKMSADKNLSYTSASRGRTSAADVLPPRKY